MASTTFEKIKRGLEEAIAFQDGARAGYVIHRAPESVDVRAIRARTKLSQLRFAERYGFDVTAVRNWEQGRRQPDRAARAYLLVIDREPEAVERALAPA